MLPLNTSHFAPKDAKQQQLSKLTDANVRFLEKNTTFTLHEKLELLRMLTHTVWITDVNVRRDRPEPDQAYVEGLAKLGLPWRAEHYVKRDGTSVYWMQVGVNEAVLDYLEQNRDRLSVLEAGILYGYPPTAVLGCVNILGPKYKPVDKKSIAEFYLSGIFSAEFVDQEVDYATKEWSRLFSFSHPVACVSRRWLRQRPENRLPFPCRTV